MAFNSTQFFVSNKPGEYFRYCAPLAMSEVLAGQVLRFQWNAYSSSWGPALRDLRTAGLFHDLTLVTADNTVVSAHKLVLAACSAFFKGSF